MHILPFFFLSSHFFFILSKDKYNINLIIPLY